MRGLKTNKGALSVKIFKEYTSGALKGSQHVDLMSMQDRDMIQIYIKLINISNDDGLLDFRINACYIVKPLMGS